MHIKNIQLQNFNNYASADVDFHIEMNALTGRNGMGKTNMLDAVYYLCIGKSYFSSGDRHIVKKEEDSFRLSGEFQDRKGKETVDIKVEPGKKKTIDLSGKKRDRLSDHIGKFPCVIIAPRDIQLMMEGSEERRKFLDNTIMQYNRSYVDAVIAYSRLLKQRNATLKAFSENHYFDPNLLESISINMFRPAQKVYEERKQLIDNLSPIFENYYKIISGDSETCEIKYRSNLEKKTIEELFRENLEKDKILNRTTTGIHKDDITLLINGEKLRNFASEGQLKSVVLALKLAQYEILSQESRELPILLLDDIFDKLDRNRVEYLLSIVASKDFGQVFISDTNSDRIPTLLEKLDVDFAVFNVEDGVINRVND